MSRKNDDVWGALPLSDKSNRANDQSELGNTRYIREMKYQKSNDIYPTSTLDEILRIFRTNELYDYADAIKGMPRNRTFGGSIDNMSEAHQAIATALEAIIGEDDEQIILPGQDGYRIMQQTVGRNQSRAEQRHRLALYLNPNSQETQ